MSKPIAFNYGQYEKALEEIRDLEEEVKNLEAKNEEMMFRVMRLKEENTNLTIHVRILEADLEAERSKR